MSKTISEERLAELEKGLDLPCNGPLTVGRYRDELLGTVFVQLPRSELRILIEGCRRNLEVLAWAKSKTTTDDPQCHYDWAQAEVLEILTGEGR